MSVAGQPIQPEQVLTDGDMGFSGLDELTQPSELQQGDVAEALNARFTNNRIDPRLGMSKMPWSSKVDAALNAPLPFAAIYGGTDFRDPAGVEWMIIAADGAVWRTRENNGAIPVTLPPGLVISAPVTFEQCTIGLVMFLGEAVGAPLYLSNIDAGFQPIPVNANTISGAGTANPTDGTVPIPAANNGTWIGNRLFIPFQKDLLGISDYLNPTRYAGVRAQARINQGSSDSLVRFFKFNDNAGIAFKSESIYILNNITGDLSTMALDEFTREYGCAAAKSCVNVGTDVWFLSEKRGICSITQTALNQFQGRDIPVSQKIKNLIARINWKYASGAVAAYTENRYYLSLPLDDAMGVGPELARNNPVYDGGASYGVPVVPGVLYRLVMGANETAASNGGTALTENGDFTATGLAVTFTGVTAGAAVTASVKRLHPGSNNAVLVYDFLKQKWAGADTGGAIMVQEWVKQTYAGSRRLFALSADGFINLYEEMPYDEVGYESFGANLVGNNPYLGPAKQTSVAVTPGRLYVWSLGIGDLLIINGTQSSIERSGAWVAQTNSMTFGGNIPFTFCNAQLQLVSYVIDVEWIALDVTLRGWTCGTLLRKRFNRALLNLETWYPEYTITAINEGANEELAVVSRATKSQTKYIRPFDRANWNPTNTNNDHATPFRQDYGVVLSDATTPSGSITAGVAYYVEDLNEAASINYNGNVITAPAMFTGLAGVTTYTVVSGTPQVYAPGSYIFAGALGFNPDQAQETAEKLNLPLSTRGKQIQLRIRSTRGRVSILGGEVTAYLADKSMGSFA